MAVKQSTYFKGNARTPVPHPARKGEAIEYLFTHTFTEAVAVADKLELFPVFPNGRIVGFDFAGENIGAINLTLGLMSGVAGSLDDARVISTPMIAAAVSTTPLASTLTQLANIPANGGAPVSVGLTVSADITAAANKKLHIRIRVAS